MSDRAVMHCDETRRPVAEKAEQAVRDLLRTDVGAATTGGLTAAEWAEFDRILASWGMER